MLNTYIVGSSKKKEKKSFPKKIFYFRKDDIDTFKKKKYINLFLSFFNHRN